MDTASQDISHLRDGGIGMKSRESRLTTLTLIVGLFALSLLTPTPQVWAETRSSNLDAIPTMRERVQVMERFWRWKRENVLPKVMREQGVDMWIIRSDEGELFFNNESPVFVSLLPANAEGLTLPSQYARPGSQQIPSFLLFHDQGSNIEYHEPREYSDIGRIVSQLDPQHIAISIFDNEALLQALGTKYADRTVSSWTLGVRWLETASAEQISVYRLVQRIASEVIAEGFSNRVVIPDVTTTADLNWWFRHRMLELGLEHENHPSMGVQRRPENIAKYDDPAEYFERGRTDNDMDVTIRRGDIISCDTDIMLFGLVTDSHQHAYVLEEGETDVPADLREALARVNRVQDRLAAEFLVDRTGKEIVAAATKIDFEEGVLEVDFGFHPPPMFIRRFLLGGFFFTTKPYVAGMTSSPGYYPTSIVTNDHPLHFNTLYAFEPHTRIAVEGWGPEGVELGLGQIVAFTPDGFRYLARAQESRWHIIQ